METLRLDLARIAPVAAPSVSEPSRSGERPEGAVPFSEVLTQSMKKVNDVQLGADKMVQKLALGEVDDVSEVSIAVEKADLALRTMMEIRNKLVDAYQQLARMSV